MLSVHVSNGVEDASKPQDLVQVNDPDQLVLADKAPPLKAYAKSKAANKAPPIDPLYPSTHLHLHARERNVVGERQVAAAVQRDVKIFEHRTRQPR